MKALRLSRRDPSQAGVGPRVQDWQARPGCSFTSCIVDDSAILKCSNCQKEKIRRPEAKRK